MPERTLRDAVDMENYERWDKGQPMKKKVKPVKTEPLPPKIKPLQVDPVTVDSVSFGKRKVLKNPEGIRFMGFEISFTDKEGKTVQGWMSEDKYLDLKRELSWTINTDNME